MPVGTRPLGSLADTLDTGEPIASRVAVLKSLSRLIELPYEVYGLLTDEWLNEFGERMVA